MALNIGELYVNITAKTSGVDAAFTALKSLEVSISNLSVSIEKLSSKISTKFETISRAAVKSAKKVEKNKGYVEYFGIVNKSAEESAAVFIAESNKKIQQKKRETQAFLHGIEVQKAKTAEQEKIYANTVQHEIKAGRQKLVAEQKAKKVAEAALLRQAELSLKAQQQVDRLSNSWRNIAGSSKYIGQVNKALSVYQSRLNKGALSSNELKSSQLLFNQAIVDAKGKIGATGKVTTGFQSRMEDLTKSVQLALGPLSGVAARITAISALFNRSTLLWAGFFAAATAGIVGFNKAIRRGMEVEKFLAQMNAQIRATGGAAGYTATQLNNMAKALAIDTLTSTKEARDAVAALTSYTSVQGDTFKETLNVAMDMSTVLGGTLVDAVKRLGKSLEDPGTVLEGLSDAGVRFTQSEKDMLQVMAKTNQMAEAQAYILGKLKSRFEGAAPAAAKGLAGAWDTLTERWGHFLEALGTTRGVLPSVTNAINNLSKILEYLTSNITNAGKETMVLTGGMKTAASTVEFLIEHLKEIGQITGIALLYKGVLSLIGRFGILDKKILTVGKSALSLKNIFNRLVLLMGAFAIGWEIGTWLRKFKIVRQVAIAFFAAIDKGIDHVVEFFELAGPRIELAWSKAFNGLKDIYLDYINTVLSGLKLMDKVGVVPNALIKSLDNFVKVVEASKAPLDEQEKKIQDIKDAHQRNRDIIDDTVVSMFMQIDAEKGATEQKKRFSASVESNTKKIDTNITATLKMIDAMNALVKEYVPGGEEIRKFNMDMEIATRNIKVNEKGVRELTFSLKDYIAAQTAGENNVASERIQQLTKDYNALTVASLYAADELAKKNPATVMLEDAKKQLTAMSQLTTGQKVIGFFEPSVITEAKAFNMAVAETESSLRGFNAAGGNLNQTVEALRSIAKERGLENLLEGLNLEGFEDDNFKDLATGLEKVNKAAKDSGSSFGLLQNAFGTIMSQMTQIVATQLSSMQEMAAYHKQMAQESLAYGRSQSQLYMELADTVHYSNNEQAKSFEMRATAAAESAARQYEAEKAAQDKANTEAKKAFELQKKLQIAQAIMSTATAVAGTLAHADKLTPPVAIALAGLIGGLGATQIGIISQQRFTPRERGGPITGGKPYLVGERGPELIIPGQGGTVMNNRDLMNNIGSGGGEVTIVFDIKANDAKGFQEMIVANKGFFINMIRQVKNENLGAGI